MSRKSMLSSSSCSRKRLLVVELRQVLVGRDVAQDIQHFFSDFGGRHAGRFSLIQKQLLLTQAAQSMLRRGTLIRVISSNEARFISVD